MLERMRYVTQRTNKAGKPRWYWQRAGHPLTRLSDDPVKRFAEQENLNKAADGRQALYEGSIGWVIDRYKESDRYKALKPGTVKYYKRFLNEIENLGPKLPFSHFTRKNTVDFLGLFDKAHQRRQAASVLKNLIDIARYHGYIDHSPATELRLSGSAPRSRIWSTDEIERWKAAASTKWPHVETAFMLLAYTAQRPGDVLAMTWAQYNGQTIRLRQHKTGVLLDVPCHPELKVYLDNLSRESLMIVSYKRRPVPYLRFNERVRAIGKLTGIDAQMRDLRRTGMVRMAEGGATAPQVASISGHSIDQTQRILETYIPRTKALAEAAIMKFAAHKTGPKV